MAKRNKGSKKRQKKHLMKRVAKIQAFKTAAGMAAIVESAENPLETPFIKTWINPVIIDSGSALPRMDLYLGKYDAENVEYQKELDAVYNGTVLAVERYMNLKSTLLHSCTECSANFYSKPEWLLSGRQPHECYSSIKGSVNQVVKAKKKKLTEADTMEMVAMAEQGITKTKIAKQFDVTRQTVINRLSKAGF